MFFSEKKCSSRLGLAPCSVSGVTGGVDTHDVVDDVRLAVTDVSLFLHRLASYKVIHYS